MTSAHNKIFLNYSTVAPLSEPAYIASKKFLDDFYQVGPPEVLYQYDPLAHELSVEAAKLLNCDADEITYIKNTSEGIIIASEALPLEAGDEVLVMGNEYGANLLPWIKKRDDGLKLTIVGDSDNEASFEALIAAVGPQTKVIAISAAQYYDGFMFDLDRVSQICREKHIYLVVDAVQTIGIRLIDLKKTQIDFLICGGQKYLQAGPGIGFMYVRRQIIPSLRATKVGLRSVESYTSDSYVLRNTAARFQDGTQNMLGIAALHASLQHINDVGIATLEHDSLALLSEIKQCLRKYELDFIDYGEHQSNIVSLRVPDAQAVAEDLRNQNVFVKAIRDIVRLSFMPDTQLSDIETFAQLTQRSIRR